MPTKLVRLDTENNPGNARWCDEHGSFPRLECVHQRSRGRGPCHGPAIRGTDACRIHSGMRSEVAKVKGNSVITAWRAIGDAGANIDYRMAVLGVLQMTWLRLAAYSELLRKQVAMEAEQAGSADEDAPDASGLVGFRYGAAGKDGTVYVQSEEVRALVALEAAERDRVVKYAKTAHDMGISDRLTSLAERWGDVVAGRITVMLAALNLSPEQEALVPMLIESHLGTIDVTAMGGDESEKP